MTIKAIFVYTDDLGRPVLRKIRGDRARAGKDFRVQAAQYKHKRLYWRGVPGCVDRFQPEWGERVIYNLPVVLDAIRSREPLWVTEGERDADLIMTVARQAATTTHQGIERMTTLQARWFLLGKGRSRINIVGDADDAGAFGMWHRYMALLDVGVDKKRIRLYRPAVGKDVTEAVAAVGWADALVRVKRRPVRKAALRYGTARAARYRSEGAAS